MRNPPDHDNPENDDASVYILCFDRHYEHAKHYVGWTRRPVEERVAEHVKGRGNALLRAVVNAGIPIHLSAVIYAGIDLERILKRTKNTARLCPRCKPEFLRKDRARRARKRATLAAAVDSDG